MKWSLILLPLILGSDFSSQPKEYNSNLKLETASPSDIEANEQKFYRSIPSDSEAL
jgi:hypothetical protein